MQKAVTTVNTLLRCVEQSKDWAWANNEIETVNLKEARDAVDSATDTFVLRLQSEPMLKVKKDLGHAAFATQCQRICDTIEPLLKTLTTEHKKLVAKHAAEMKFA